MITRESKSMQPPMSCVLTFTNLPSLLSGQALEALAEFYSERDLQKQRLQSLKIVQDGARKDAALSMAAFGEDWNVSQFWVRSTRASEPAQPFQAVKG